MKSIINRLLNQSAEAAVFPLAGPARFQLVCIQMDRLKSSLRFDIAQGIYIESLSLMTDSEADRATKYALHYPERCKEYSRKTATLYYRSWKEWSIARNAAKIRGGSLQKEVEAMQPWILSR